MNKVVFDCERMKYHNTGLFHYCLNLGWHLQQNIDSSFEELTFFSPPGIHHLFGPGSLHEKQNSFQKFLMPSAKKFDVWHTTYQNSDYLPARNSKVKVVLSIHDLNFLYEKKHEWKKRKHLLHLQRNIDRADVIVCVSTFAKKDLLENCNTRNKPVHVIHNGTNTLSDASLLRNSYRPRKPFLFSIGVLNRKKNFHVLLPLLKQNRDMELVIAGRLDDIDYLNYIHRFAKQLQVDDSLQVLGQINENEKSWYFSNCYAYTQPSLAEGFGLPVTEAMSTGKPMFLSSRTALPEIGSDVAFYFDDFDATQMQKVFLTGMHQYKKLNMEWSIKQRGLSFCWNKAAYEYINIYRSLY